MADVIGNLSQLNLFQARLIVKPRSSTRFRRYFSSCSQEEEMHIVETCWRQPISVRLHNGIEHTFHSVENTLDFLENEWPTRSGAHRRRATDLCRAALNRIGSAEAAREAVISACLEANMPLAMRYCLSSQTARPISLIA
jgi:hypothetical protein